MDSHTADFLLRRTLFCIVTFVIIVSVVFFLLRLAPGGPFDGERALTPEIEANLKAAYNLDAPLIEQYLDFWSSLLAGDLGPSFRQKDFDVNSLVANGFPISLRLGSGAIFVAVLLGLAIGISAGLRPGSRVDRAFMAVNNMNLALPALVTAPLLILLFSVNLGWFPAGGAYSAGHYILPMFALALPFSAQLARLIRGGVAATLNEPHIRTARAKGIGEARIVRLHILPIALIPAVSFLAPACASILAGSVVIEQIFDLPGIGRYFVQGALDRDYTLVMGVTIIYAGAILCLNLAADLMYGWLDPRIRKAQQ